ncbi:MAG: protein-L-isoaspartate(D-aspartate) O-methyltransferase, partial [Prevotellaceae bacterium]|nr:protein-L-isoaspartate(D-aspartate) O-methyltransferase [Prevotellaceae bacterium]
MNSDYHYTIQRKKLVAELSAKGITCPRVLDAIGKVPRHIFFAPALKRFAYNDGAYPIAAGQTISHPSTVAFQTQALDIKAGEKILEVGTGSGYQCAVLCEMGAAVYSIERQLELFESAYKLLPQLGYNPRLRFGDGYEGSPKDAPFDKILITASAPQVPQKLLAQLKTGGVMLVPVATEMLRITRKGENDF